MQHVYMFMYSVYDIDDIDRIQFPVPTLGHAHVRSVRICIPHHPMVPARGGQSA